MKSILTLSFCLFLALYAQAQTPCSLDNSFDTDGKLVADASRLGEHILLQTDGKILVACNPFGNGSVYIKRFNTDGSVDMSYGVSGKCTITVAEVATRITSMKMYNNKVYVCGTTSTNIGGTSTYVYAAAVTSAGALDNTFGTAGVKKFNSSPDLYTCSDLEIDKNGKIYMIGLEWLDNLFLLRMNSNGSLDNTFGTGGITYLATGNVNHWFEVRDLNIDENDKLLIAGKKYKANNGSSIAAFWNLMVLRYLPSGQIDNSFGTAGMGLYNSSATNFDEGVKIHVLPGNEYLVHANTYDNTDYDYSALKLQNNGAIQTTYGVNGWAVHDLLMTNDQEYSLNSALLPDGRLLITGNQGDGDTVHFSLLMLKSDGSRDNTFAPNGLYMHIFNQNNNSSSSGLAVAPDGKIVLGGYTRTCANGVCGPLSMALSRYHNSFNSTGVSDLLSMEDLILSPNPSKGQVQILSSKILHQPTLTIWNGMGQVMGRYTYSGGSNFSLMLPETTGMYFIQIRSEEGMEVMKVVRE
ncbi:MAG: T9SS type A sorting domain-containing protein [Chitinophagaceae bacterium]|nr:T9SS type A sorting domain-containing protein [Chitinophagaceae bacterium]